jgi:hypothetical protein
MTDTIDTTTWTPQQKAAYAALQLEVEKEEKRLSDLAEEATALAASPDTALAAKAAELSAKRAAREKQERDAADDLAYDVAVKELGESRVARVRTVEGSIIMRPLTDVELDVAIHRSEGKTELDKVKIHKEAVKKTVRHPSPEKFTQIVGKYPALWGDLYEARDALISGREEEREKKG